MKGKSQRRARGWPWTGAQALRLGSVLLLRWMGQNGYRQLKLAEEIGCSQNSISRWLVGGAPKLRAVERIASLTGGAVPVESWFKSPTPAQRTAHERLLEERRNPNTLGWETRRGGAA